MLSPTHDRAAFSCGVGLVDWHLHKEALSQMQASLSRTYVLVSAQTPLRIDGFFSLEAGVMPTSSLPGSEDGPPRVPVIYLSYLGRDLSRKGQGFGDLLLIEALRLAEAASHIVGAAGVHLYSLDSAVDLYVPYGFRQFQDDPRNMFLPMRSVRRTMSLVDTGPPDDDHAEAPWFQMLLQSAGPQASDQASDAADADS